jgi:hypothetical protein
MSATMIDHLNAIYTNQALDYYDTLPHDDQKTYSAYMINRFLSMNLDYVCVVNEFQEYLNEISPRESYLFFSQLVPKGKQFNRYVKSATQHQYEEWMVDHVATYFAVAKRDAVKYITIMYMTVEGKAELRHICEIYQVDSKKLSKAKL